MICVRQLSLECIAHLIVTFVLSDKRRRHRRLSRTTSLMLVRTTVPRPLYNYTRNTAGRLTCRRQRRRRRTTPHPFAYNMPRGSSVIIPIAQHMYYVRYATRVQMRCKRQTPPTDRAGNWTACVVLWLPWLLTWKSACRISVLYVMVGLPLESVPRGICIPSRNPF